MKKSEWGPVVWTTLHVFSVHVRDVHFQEAKKELIETIISVMANLPCPNCSSHALGMVKKLEAIFSFLELLDDLFLIV